jgi:hypothetical protein
MIHSLCTVSHYTSSELQVMVFNQCQQNPSLWMKNIRWEDVSSIESYRDTIAMTVIQEYTKYEFIVQKTPLAEQAFEPYIIFDEE